MKGRSKAYHHTHGTAEKISKHVAKHRASGGKTEESGDDDVEKDLKETPPDRSGPNKIAEEAKAMKAKRGGKMIGKVEGEKAMHHAGRKARKSGGAAEDSPFTTANSGTPARGRKLMSESMGRDT